MTEITEEMRQAVRNMKGSVPTDYNIDRIVEAVTPVVTRLRAENAELQRRVEEAEEKLGVSLTVGGGLSVHGSMDAIMRVQNYIMLDSRHPIEKEDVRRSLAMSLQAAETRADALQAEVDRVRKALKPFVDAFEARRNAYSKRYQNQALGYKNFDKMPDMWPMEKITFNMSDFRRACQALGGSND